MNNIINPTKRAKSTNPHYSTIFHGCTNIRSDETSILNPTVQCMQFHYFNKKTNVKIIEERRFYYKVENLIR